MKYPVLPIHMLPSTRDEKISNTLYLVFQLNAPKFWKETNIEFWTLAGPSCECCVASDQKNRDKKWNQLIKTYERNRRQIHN